ncbi:MAG: competence/damage-inducible protein A [Planctomycetota bacterium]
MRSGGATAWIVSIGTELTLGRALDTNANWLAGRLAELGYRATRFVVVPDDEPAIRAALYEAAEHAELVMATGGLGPTEDDLTRGALAAAAGVPLVLDEVSLEQMRAFFARRGRVMPEANRVQAYIPQTGTALANACGTAPGIRMVLKGTPCYVMPGVPFEMRAMFDGLVAPELRERSRGAVLRTRELRTYGLPESTLGERIADLMRPGGRVTVGTSAGYGLITIRLSAAAADPAQADALLDETEAELRRRLGAVVYGRDSDTLAGVVGRLLESRGRTVATGESCTGGLIAKLLTDTPGSSRYFRGGIVAYANDAKERVLGVSPTDLASHGAVSAVVARAMATGAARALGADYGLGVTGIAGPEGGSAEKPVGLVYIGHCGPRGADAVEYRFGGDAPREAIRLRAAWAALDWVRQDLLGDAAPAPDGPIHCCDSGGR